MPIFLLTRRWAAALGAVGAGLALTLLMGAGWPAVAPAPLRKDLKRDFGAVGDGRANDQAAFQRAADFFNKRALTPDGAAPAVLTIPKGVYVVGQPEITNNPAGVLSLQGCRNLRIVGDDSATTEIRYAPGLHYGAFDPSTRLAFEAPSAFFTDPIYAARVGTCIELKKCENVEVNGLTVNGNVGAALIGGHWGDVGIQLNYDAVFVNESRHVLLRRLALHHMGRDGAQVHNHLAKSLDDPNQDDITFDGVSCRYNGRQGLSLTGVNGFRAVNCSFSHTGRVVIPALGKPLFSNPGAGVDLEPEGGYVANVRLDNCRLVDNAGQGIVSDRPGGPGGPVTVKNVVIANSLVWGVSNWSAWVTQPGFLFQNTRIYGAFVHGCRAATPTDATRFVGCTFEDRPYHGKAAYGMFELHSDRSSRSMSFTDCQFVGTHNYLMFAIIAEKDTASFFHFRRCTFLYDYQQPLQGSYNNLQGSVFQGVNTVRDGPHRSSMHPTAITLGNGALPAPTSIKAPGSLRLLATNCVYNLINGLDVGREMAHRRDTASLVIGRHNLVVLHQTFIPNPELYVGPTSRLVVKKGGTLEILHDTRLTVAGQLVVEDGAYLFIDPKAVVTTTGRGQLRVGAGAIKTRNPALRSGF